MTLLIVRSHPEREGRRKRGNEEVRELRGEPWQRGALRLRNGRKGEAKMELEKMLREMIQQAVDERINDAAVSDVDEFTIMSFEIRKTHLKKLRDYAFTNRLKIKEALDEALAQYLDPIDDSSLMEYPEKPKKTRKRG